MSLNQYLYLLPNAPSVSPLSSSVFQELSLARWLMVDGLTRIEEDHSALCFLTAHGLMDSWYSHQIGVWCVYVYMTAPPISS
jgi:hypothetical protein